MLDGELDLELMSEEEAQAYKEQPPISDEPEPTPAVEEKVDTVEPSPPKIEEPPVEPIAEIGKPTLEPPKEPAKEPEKPPAIDGIIAKDGKNFIPFSVLEEERTKRQDAEKLAKETAEKHQRLEAEIVELRKPKPEPVKEPVKVEPKFDLDAVATEFATKTYASEEDAIEATKVLIKTLKDEITKDVKGLASETATSATVEAEFNREADRIKAANSWIKPGFMEEAIKNRAVEIIQERGIRPTDVRGLVKATEDAVLEAKGILRIDEPKVDVKAEIAKAVEAAVKAEREKVTKEVLAKFNIKEPEVVTLADVRNLNPDLTSKFDELDKLVGIDYEEGYAQLTPQEQEAFLKYRSA